MNIHTSPEPEVQDMVLSKAQIIDVGIWQKNDLSVHVTLAWYRPQESSQHGVLADVGNSCVRLFE